MTRPTAQSEGAGGVVDDELAVRHPADAGHHRGEGADHRHEPGQDDRLWAVPSKELLSAHGVIAGEDSRVRAVEHPGSKPSTQEIAHLVAGTRGNEDPESDQPERHLENAGGAEHPGAEQQGITRQEEADEQTRLDKDDRHDKQHADGAKFDKRGGQ